MMTWHENLPTGMWVRSWGQWFQKSRPVQQRQLCPKRDLAFSLDSCLGVAYLIKVSVYLGALGHAR